jgi:hypothetical protein
MSNYPRYIMVDTGTTAVAGWDIYTLSPNLPNDLPRYSTKICHCDNLAEATRVLDALMKER